MTYPSSQPNLLLMQARRDRGFSQADLASQLGVSRKAVWRWEHGLAMPYPRHCYLLCRFFHKTAEELGLAPSSTRLSEAEITDISQNDTVFESLRNNPLYQREYRAYLQRCQQIHQGHHGTISFLDWLLAAHPEQVMLPGSEEARTFHQPA
jgi:DNA-binding XRE family transcriptional regulator